MVLMAGKILRRYSRLVKLILATTLPIGGLVLLASFLAFSGFFRINQIVCRAEGKAGCSELILAELDQYRGERSFLLPTREIADDLQKADRVIKSSEVGVDLPATLRVVLTHRTAVLQVTTSRATDQVLLVDGEGVIIEKSELDDEQLTLIWPEGDSWPIEERLPDYLRQAISLAVLVEEEFGFLSPPTVTSNRSMKGEISTGQRVIFSLVRGKLKQLETLQLVLSQAKMDGGGEIDLRFERPVVR